MYTLINKTEYKYKLLNFNDKFISIISLLEHIEYELYVLKKHNITKKIDFKTFNNLFIQQTSYNNTVINIYKFDFSNFTIIDINKNNVNINPFDENVNNTYNYLINNIKKLLNIVNKKLISNNLKDNKNTIFKKSRKINKKDLKKEKTSDKNECLDTEELQKKNHKNAEIFMEKEKKSEKKSIFKSDVIIFKKIKEEIKLGKRTNDNLPELFKIKYPVLLEMEENKLIEDSENYEIYHELINNDDNEKKNYNDEIDSSDKEYIPHNINYKENTYKSLTKMLEEISSIDSDTDSLSD